MKKRIKRMNLVGMLFFASLLIFSCKKEESPELIVEQETFDVAELKASDEAELISEEILNIGEDVYTSDEIITTSKSNYSSDYLPDCVTITTVVTSTSKEKTIDFGDGCELPNGNILSGIIYLSYLKDMDLATKTLSLDLENFVFNGVAVEGSASVERMRSNSNGNPQADAVASFSAEWPDGSTASFTGNRTREWIEGFGSGFWGDNVFLISGKGTYTGQMGNVFMKETITPLRRELSCRFIVSGVLELSRNDATASLDFGDGSCDAKGILTHPDGTTEEIFLRRFFN
jgi:phage tail tube protein FII